MHGTENEEFISKGLFGNLPFHADCYNSIVNDDKYPNFCACAYK